MEILLNSCVSYLVIIDPLGVALIFTTLTRYRSDEYKRRMAFRSVAISLLLVVFFGFFGAALLEQLGIAIDSFRIAGGLLLFYTAFNMVTQDDDGTGPEQGMEENDISVFPLSIPLMAGPGCLTLTVLLFANAKQQGGIGYLLVGVVLVYLLTLGILIFSSRVSKIMGATGNSILKRLFGVLLAALSIQFIADGIGGFVAG